MVLRPFLEENVNKVAKKMVVILASAAAGVCITACSSSAESAAVQNVGELAGLGNVGSNGIFAGIVSARGEETVKSDSAKTILEVCVSEGDEVEEGQTLLKYDMSETELSLEKSQLELEQLNNSLSDKQSEKTTLEAQKAEAGEDSQLEYTLQIQKCDTEIREAQYNITLKQKEVETLQQSLEITEVTSPIAGHVRKMTLPESDSYSGDDDSSESGGAATIVIMEAGTYRIMGYVNENNVSQIEEGMAVTVHSRVNDDTWSGSVETIEWENAATSGTNSEYSENNDSDLEGTSKYPFYIELDSSEGLLLGQHVYIEMGADNEEGSRIEIPSYFFVDVDGNTACVWAENASGKLEKRSVAVSISEDDSELFIVESGLETTDYIAYPSEDLKAGMNCEKFESGQDGVSEDLNGSEDYEDGFEEYQEYEADSAEEY